MESENIPQENAPTSAPAEGSSAPTISTAGTNSDPAGTTPSSSAPPAFTPNIKFKAFDKEFEVEEMFRGLMTDVEKEKAVKKLHEKAYALDGMKADREKVRQEYNQYKQVAEPERQVVKTFNEILKNKDWDTFFGKLGVPDEEIFGWVQKRLAMLQATPEQRAEYARQTQIREQNYIYQHQMEDMRSQYETQAVQTRTMQLDSVMSRPDIGQTAVSWDSQIGRVGAFKELVIDTAKAHFLGTGQDLSAEQAVDQVMQRFGKVIPQGQGQMTQSPQGTGMSTQGNPNSGNPPIIPHIQGRGTSPVKKVPKNLADLKKLAKEMQANS